MIKVIWGDVANYPIPQGILLDISNPNILSTIRSPMLKNETLIITGADRFDKFLDFLQKCPRDRNMYIMHIGNLKIKLPKYVEQEAYEIKEIDNPVIVHSLVNAATIGNLIGMLITRIDLTVESALGFLSLLESRMSLALQYGTKLELTPPISKAKQWLQDRAKKDYTIFNSKFFRIYAAIDRARARLKGKIDDINDPYIVMNDLFLEIEDDKNELV